MFIFKDSIRFSVFYDCVMYFVELNVKILEFCWLLNVNVNGIYIFFGLFM